jgi:hypothetical protein
MIYTYHYKFLCVMIEKYSDLIPLSRSFQERVERKRTLRMYQDKLMML